MITTIKIEFLDTFFLRDGKPFTMGDETWADGLFLPLPTTIYGALRTVYATHNSIAVEKINEKTASLRIQNIYYWANNIYVPYPLDLVQLKDSDDENQDDDSEKEYSVKKLKLMDVSLKQKFVSNSPIELLSSGDNSQVKEVEGGMMAESDLKTYLQGKMNEFKVKKLANYFRRESKVGIGREDQTRAAEETKLYRVDMIRPMNHFSIFVSFEEITELKFPESGFIKIGGEGKVARFTKTNKKFDITKSDFNLAPKQFKLYLATPAIFKNGWYSDLSREGINIKATLLTACVGKPINIGGFDMEKNEPKPMYKAVRAGSVYYYETTEEPDVIIEKLQGQSISEIYDQQGFGIAYIGNF